jgi:hypothetical protein
MHRVWERLVRLAEKHGTALRQSSERADKHALIAHRCYARAKRFKRANRALRTLRTGLGRVTRDYVAQDQGKRRLEAIFRLSLVPARWVRASARTSAAKRACPRAPSRGSNPCMRPRLDELQGQSASLLRVRRQSVGRHHASPQGPMLATEVSLRSRDTLQYFQCEFRRNPAGHSDLMSATVPI